MKSQSFYFQKPKKTIIHIFSLVKSFGVIITSIAIANILFNFYPEVFKALEETLFFELIAIYINIREVIFASVDFIVLSIPFSFAKEIGYPWFNMSSLFRDILTISLLMSSSVIKVWSELDSFNKIQSLRGMREGFPKLLCSARNIKYYTLYKIKEISSKHTLFFTIILDLIIKWLFIIYLYIIYTIIYSLLFVCEIIYFSIRSILALPLLVLLCLSYIFMIIMYLLIFLFTKKKIKLTKGNRFVLPSIVGGSFHFFYSIIALLIIIFISYLQNKIGL